MNVGFETLEGWFCLHDFRTMNWAAWKVLSQKERDDAKEELFGLINRWRHVDAARQGGAAVYDIAGNKADLLFLNLRPTMDALIDVQHDFNKSRFAEFLQPSDSFVSVVELSNYVVNADKRPEDDPAVQARLKPEIPKTNHACFYPMNKRREGADNWYMQPLEERKRMMREHGMKGMKYKGQVTQMICGAIGLDDWEWGVTLFANDPLVFKKVVTDMRFDEVSARYAEFGKFFVGRYLSNDRLLDVLK